MTDRHRNVVHAPALPWIEPLSAPFGNGSSTLGFPEIAVYPDSKKVGLLGGPSSLDPNGVPLIQVTAHGQTLGYYDGEDE